MATTSKAQQQGPLRPTDVQRPFVDRDAPFYAFISGIGAGKTTGGIIRSLREVSEWNVGSMGAIVAPTIPSLRQVIIPELEKWGVLDRCEYKETEKRLDFPNGSTIILESADNPRKIDRLRGLNLAWFWMDEAAVIDESAWDVLVGRLRVGNYQNGFVTTTPRGKHNWVYQRFVKGDPDDVRAVTGVSTQDNPHTPTFYREQIVDQFDGQYYEQEVLGKFVAFEGLVYPWFGEDNLVDEPPADYDEVVYGVDWGYNNPAVCLTIVRSDNQWFAVDEWYERRCTAEDHARAVGAMQERWGPGTIYCDPSEPANIEVFQRERLDARPAVNDVIPGIQHVSSLRDRLFVVRSCQSLRNEFAQYQYEDDDTKDQPLKQNDHAVDGLRYGLFSYHEERGRPGGNVYSLGM